MSDRVSTGSPPAPDEPEPSGRTVLFLTTVWPGARRSGGELVSQAFIESIRGRGHRVVVIGYRRAGEMTHEHHHDLIAGERPIETQAAGARALVWLARAALTGLPYSAAKYASRSYRRRVAQVLARSADVVVIDHAQSAWVLRAVPVTMPTIYLAHNVEHQLYREPTATLGRLRRRIYNREARRVRIMEQGLLGRARQTWALSAEDAAALKRLGGAAAIRRFAPPPGVARAASPPQTDIVMLGKWSWAANAVGLDWFLEEVVPHMSSDLHVEIAGAGAKRTSGHPPGIRIRGVVESASDFLATGRVIAIPARAGAGVQIKTLDAIATGRPVVATSLAVRGLEQMPPTVEIEDDPVVFAQRLGRAAAASPSQVNDEAVDAWVAERRSRFDAEVRDAIQSALSDRAG
jgi:hypothetical protein